MDIPRHVFRRRIAMFGPPLVVLLLAALVYDAMQRRRQSTQDVRHTYEVIGVIDDLRARLVNAEAGQRSFILSGESRDLAPHHDAARDVERTLERLRALMQGHPTQQARLDSLEMLVEGRLTRLATGIDLRRTSGFEAAREQAMTDGGPALMREVRRILSRLEAEEERLLAARDTREDRHAESVTWVLLGGGVLVILASALTHGLLSSYAGELETANAELKEKNAQLEDQALELEMQSEELQTQASHLEETMVELETANEELLDQRKKLESMAAELEKSNAALRERTDEAERANQAKSDFLAVMSHELRTPLNAIAGYVQLLEMGVHGPVTERQIHALERVQRNQSYLLALINDILNFAKIETGRIEIRSSDVPVEEVLTGLEDLIGPQVSEKELRYACHPCDASARMRGDRERIEQILINLLTNAIKFTDRGGQVTVGCDMDDEQVRISVRDTGCGIPGHKLEEIFDPFVQVRRDRAAQGQGVGLGLAISRELARSMGGDLTAESREGEGSTFTLHLTRGRRVKAGNIFAASDDVSDEPAESPQPPRAANEDG